MQNAERSWMVSVPPGPPFVWLDGVSRQNYPGTDPAGVPVPDPWLSPHRTPSANSAQRSPAGLPWENRTRRNSAPGYPGLSWKAAKTLPAGTPSSPCGSPRLMQIQIVGLTQAAQKYRRHRQGLANHRQRRNAFVVPVQIDRFTAQGD